MTTSNADSFLNFHTAGWIFSLIVVLPENSYVIWLIVTGAGNGVASEFFSLNLSICEILLCLQSFLSLVARAFRGVWFFVGFLTGIPITGRPLFQCLICVERYLAVVQPVTFLKYKPLRYRVICSTAAWIMILVSCVFASFTVFKFQMYLFVCYCLSQALLTFCIMLFCCLAVLRALKQSGPGEKRREEENNMKRRAFKIIVMIIMAMLLIYASYLFTGLSYALTDELILTLWCIGQICFLLGGLVQPLLYLHRNGNLSLCKTP
ncbi:Chemokine XC receptor 1 [Anabarilius grahami]|uniref:Chemokine XC receptor 1 n=1 Tax=Anabarilius grahami TaxID=495550 RepID=A0A3N0XSP1_ANAGA|nr:Chemokine XC receptor 1 [Anabarilius grahami]